MKDTAQIRRVGNVVDAELDGEAILLNLDQDAVFGLGPVGSRIWELIDPSVEFVDLCATLVDEFAVDPAQCAQQTSDFVDELRDLGLVEVIQ